MRYSMILSLLTSLYTSISLAEAPKMKDNIFFTINVSCSGQKECTYNNQSEIPVTVRFQNLYSKGYYIPLEYIKKTGPSIKLTDRGNKKSMPLKPNLVSWGLKKKMTYIPEGGNIEFTWTLLDRDISQFINDGNLNVDADFKIRTKIYDDKDSEIGDFISMSRLVLKGSNLNEDKR
ncbi:hypothetical protein OI909_14060 [Enterobacter asburiae]|uniref:hypothetical protein n=2 Tax=Enterobacter asburiae TaxID=61645 RepID=UPI001A91489C|nr:hypothetical protein [Enterobacter asburiae]WIK22583.1 hypothetical protein OI909_14060 [Enterobacter asburiae]BCT19962.1 hypothetical protein R2TS_31340 [Enterobacter asburiae]